MNSVKGLQFLLRASGADLAVDGVFGPETARALSATPKQSLRDVATEFAIRPVISSGANGDPRRVFVSRAEIDAGIAAAVKQFGPEVAPFLETMIKFENWPAAGGVSTTFSGTFKGVAQFSKETWDLGAAKFPLAGSYANVTSTQSSLLLAAWYYLDHKGIYNAFRKKNGLTAVYDPLLAYLFHQQGAAAAQSFLLKGRLQFPGQSQVTVAAFTALRRQIMV